MIYDLKRSVDLRWSFDPVLHSSLDDLVCIQSNQKRWTKSDLPLFSFKGEAPNEPTFKEKEIEFSPQVLLSWPKTTSDLCSAGSLWSFLDEGSANKVSVKRGSKNTSHSQKILVYNPDNMLAAKIQGVFLMSLPIFNSSQQGLFWKFLDEGALVGCNHFFHFGTENREK